MNRALNSEGQSYETLRQLREQGRPALDDPVKVRQTAQDMARRGCRIGDPDQFLQRYRMEVDQAPRPAAVDRQGRRIQPEDVEADQYGWQYGKWWARKHAERLIREGWAGSPSDIAEGFRRLRHKWFTEKSGELFPDKDFLTAWEMAANVTQFILDVLVEVSRINCSDDRSAN